MKRSKLASRFAALAGPLFCGPAIVVAVLISAEWFGAGPRASLAQSDAAAMVRLLKGGRLPPERLSTVLNLVYQRGNAEDLAYVYTRAMQPDGFPPEVRRQAIEGLAAAAQTRKVQPPFDAAGLASLLKSSDAPLRRAAIRLAGAWKAEALSGELSRIALASDTDDATQRLAIDALSAIGGEAARELATKLLADKQPGLRAFGVAALAAIDVDQAAPQAAKLFADPQSASSVDVVLAPFLGRQGGSDRLAAAFQAASPPPDTAKLALRQMYLSGRSDARLVEVLSKAAGLDAERPPLTPDELQKLSAEVLAKGDAARGEQIFRRADLGCLKCHAVSAAGGDVGPDLSAVGATSPVDYVITSILTPDLSIKENYLTRHFVTSSGLIHQGIVADRDDQRVIVKDGTGQRITIPTADIDDEIEGRSLMPKGLVGFMTQAEFLDLVRFVAGLGKPGEYAVRSQPTVQRWRYLKSTPVELAQQVPDEAAFAQHIDGPAEGEWLPAYAKVAGGLPLAELAGEDRKVLYLRGEVDVSEPGEIEIKLDSIAGVTAWIDRQPLPSADAMRAKLGRGLHSLTLRIDPAQRKNAELRVVIDKPTGSSAVYTVVGGR